MYFTIKFFVRSYVKFYIIQSIEAIYLFFLKIIHIGCIARGLHRVAKRFRDKFHNVDLLISIIKKYFEKHHIKICNQIQVSRHKLL